MFLIRSNGYMYFERHQDYKVSVILNWFADGYQSLLKTVGKRFLLRIRELHPRHLSTVMAGFCLRQFARSECSRSQSRKSLLSANDGSLSPSDCSGVEPATLDLHCNHSYGKLQPLVSEITVNAKKVEFQVHFFQSQRGCLP